MEYAKHEICIDILALFREYGNIESINKCKNPLTSNIFNADFVDSFSVTSIIALVEERFDYSFSAKQLQGNEIRTIEGMADILIRRNLK